MSAKQTTDIQKYCSHLSYFYCYQFHTIKCHNSISFHSLSFSCIIALAVNRKTLTLIEFYLQHSTAKHDRSLNLVPLAGLEPARISQFCRILSSVCKPIPPQWHISFHRSPLLPVAADSRLLGSVLCKKRNQYSGKFCKIFITSQFFENFQTQ